MATIYCIVIPTSFSAPCERLPKEAFCNLIEDWAGLLVSDNYGIYQSWVHAPQPCLAHLIRTARGVGPASTPLLLRVGLGAGGITALMPDGQGVPDREVWRAFYARLCNLNEGLPIPVAFQVKSKGKNASGSEVTDSQMAQYTPYSRLTSGFISSILIVYKAG